METQALTISPVLKASVLRVLTEVLERAFALSKSVRDASDGDESEAVVAKLITEEAQALSTLLLSIGKQDDPPAPPPEKGTFEAARDLLDALSKAERDGELMPLLSKLAGVEVEIAKTANGDAAETVVAFVRQARKTEEGEGESK